MGDSTNASPTANLARDWKTILQKFLKMLSLLMTLTLLFESPDPKIIAQGVKFGDAFDSGIASRLAKTQAFFAGQKGESIAGWESCPKDKICFWQHQREPPKILYFYILLYFDLVEADSSAQKSGGRTYFELEYLFLSSGGSIRPRVWGMMLFHDCSY